MKLTSVTWEIDPSEVAPLRQVLGIEALQALNVNTNERIVSMAQEVQAALQEVRAMKASSDRIEQVLDNVVEKLDEMVRNGSLSNEDRTALDEIVSTGRSEAAELMAAADRAEQATGGGGQDPDDGGDGDGGEGGGQDPLPGEPNEEPIPEGDQEPTASGRKGVKKKH